MPVNERVKDAPASVLRAVAAGLGQILGLSDKLRGKPAAAPPPAAAAPETAAPETAAAEPTARETASSVTVLPSPAAETATGDAAVAEPAVAETAAPATEPKAAAKPKAPAKPKAGGHVKLVPADEVAAATPAAAEPAAAAPAAVAEPAAAEPVPAAAAAELPLPNYDELTIASLRARLRNLSADQLGQLIEYEKGHAGRADVITMFERRIAKLAEG